MTYGAERFAVGDEVWCPGRDSVTPGRVVRIIEGRSTTYLAGMPGVTAPEQLMVEMRGGGREPWNPHLVSRTCEGAWALVFLRAASLVDFLRGEADRKRQAFEDAERDMERLVGLMHEDLGEVLA